MLVLDVKKHSAVLNWVDHIHKFDILEVNCVVLQKGRWGKWSLLCLLGNYYAILTPRKPDWLLIKGAGQKFDRQQANGAQRQVDTSKNLSRFGKALAKAKQRQKPALPLLLVPLLGNRNHSWRGRQLSLDLNGLEFWLWLWYVYTYWFIGFPSSQYLEGRRAVRFAAMYEEEMSSDGGLTPGSFEIFKAEGDVLFKQGEFKKALTSYGTVCKLQSTWSFFFWGGGIQGCHRQSIQLDLIKQL